MKLNYQKDYQSITRFNPTDLPDFVVLTGVNGSGKSHLLEAIENGSVNIDGDSAVRVVRFDYMSFFLENEATYNARQIAEERNSAWSYLQNTIKPHVESLRNTIGADYETLVAIAKKSGKSLLDIRKNEINDENIYNKLVVYKKKLRVYFNKDGIKNNQQAQTLLSAARTTPYSIDTLERDYFDDIYKPYQFKNDFLPQQIGKVVWDYYIKYRHNEVNEFQSVKHGKQEPFLSEEEFIKLHGDKPWEVINNILANFGTIEYRLPSPVGSDYFSDFEFKLEHPTSTLKINFSSLSSGEKVLMALVASIYKTSSDHHFPDVLLLDEIDASLHPSMIKNLLTTIDQIFLKNGTKVVLVTHSPTTVALAPEESVYVMNKTGEDRIVKKSKPEALSILTEGYATLEEGLKIFDEVLKQDTSIITEGNNVVYIKKALELNNVNGVGVITGIDDITGKEQLKTIFDFLSKVEHRRKVIFVWDCDANTSRYTTLTSTNNTHPFIFENNEANKLADKGIENLFAENLFDGFVKEINVPGKPMIREFFSEKKKELAERIVGRNNIQDFDKFTPLIEKVKEIQATSV